MTNVPGTETSTSASPTNPSSLRTKAKLVAGVFWTLLGTVGHRALGAVASIGIGRILGPAVFGQYAMVHSTVNLFTAFAGFRLGSTSTKYIAEFREKDPARAGRILGLVLVATVGSCVLLSLVMLVMSPWLAANRLNKPELTLPIAIGAGYLFLMMIGNVLLRTLAGFEEFRSIAIVGVVRGILSVLICIPMAYFFGLVGAVVALVVTSGVAAVQTLWMIRNAADKNKLIVPFKPKVIWKEWSILSSFALPAMLTGFVLVATAWQGRAMLMQSANGDFELGVFSAADQLRLIVMFLPNAIGNVMLPMLSRSSGNEDQAEFDKTMLMNLMLALRIALPAAMVGIAVSTILVFFFGEKYTDAVEVIPIVMLAVFVYSLNQACRQAFTATGKIWTNFWMHVIAAIIFIAACFFCIPRWGAIGFAYVHIISDSALLVMQLAFASAFILQVSIRNLVLQFALGAIAISAVIYIGWIFGPNVQAFAAAVAALLVAAPSIQLAWKTRQESRKANTNQKSSLSSIG